MSQINRIIINSSEVTSIASLPLNHAVLADRTLYVSGCIGFDKSTTKLVEGGIIPETKQALKNLGYILKEGNSGFDKVVKCTVLLQDLNDFTTVNEIYKEFFTVDYPARTAYQVVKLPMDAQIEIEVIALTGDVQTIPARSKV